MMKASLDLGTNTALLLILDGERIVEDRSTLVRLGKGVDGSGMLDPAAIERTCACLREYATILRGHGLEPRDVVAVATATARDARNGATFFSRAESETGFRFRTITGEEEAEASFRGALLPGVDSERALVFDLGGGSLELRTKDDGISLQMGSVRFTERFLATDPVTDNEFWACEEAIDSLLEPLVKRFGGAQRTVLGVAGSVVTLAAVHLALPHFDRGALDGLTLTRGDVHRLVEDFKWRTRAERLAMPGMERGREDVILAGALIVWRLLEKLGHVEFSVSTRGLRFGILG